MLEFGRDEKKKADFEHFFAPEDHGLAKLVI
jgi:hypothetical protein